MIGYIPKIKLYNYLQVGTISEDPSGGEAGEIIFVRKNKTDSGSLRLYTGTGWRPLIHTIKPGSNITSVIQDSSDPGIVTINAAGGGGPVITEVDGSTAACVIARIDSSAALNASGVCYLYPLPLSANPYVRYVKVDVYNAEYQPVNAVYGIIQQGATIKVDFGSKENYVSACADNTTDMIVQVLLAKAYDTSVRNTVPDLNSFSTKTEADQYESNTFNNMTSAGHIDNDIKDQPGVPASPGDIEHH